VRPLLLLDVVGLTLERIGEETPNLRGLAQRGVGLPMRGVFPAVTCSAQASMLTGTQPSAHGAVGNGWFFRDLGEVLFWRQSNRLVDGPKVYERARERDASFTCAKLFWWWNMGAAVDWSVTPKPFYPADGRKILGIYGTPRGFEDELERELGPFPFFDFWGPRSGLGSSRWIADATLRTLERERPTLTMAYLPHLDYDLQRYGPDDERARTALVQIDAIVGELVAAADARGAETVVVSEYGIDAVHRAVHPNRALREAGLLAVRETPHGEVLDTFESGAFAVTDHQAAHVYARDDRSLAAAAEVLSRLDGVERVLDEDGKRELGIDHRNAGDRVLVAERDAWFAYPYWLDDSRAPDFAPTVDIHRKPGYDPCELFVDPALRMPALRVARRLLQKKLGMRYLMDVVPLDASLVRGSHGRPPESPGSGPVFLSSRGFGPEGCGDEPSTGEIEMTSLPERLLTLLGLAD